MLVVQRESAAGLHLASFPKSLGSFTYGNQHKFTQTII